MPVFVNIGFSRAAELLVGADDLRSADDGFLKQKRAVFVSKSTRF
jgi:hypothetical protein